MFDLSSVSFLTIELCISQNECIGIVQRLFISYIYSGAGFLNQKKTK